MTGLAEILPSAARQSNALRETDHRPWPLPAQGWVVGQSWLDLLFAHWPVDPVELRPHVPEALELDTFEGCCWLGVSPFRLQAFRLRGLPPAPYISNFLEVNVRTYVTHGGKPGIWFFSLHAT